MTPVRTVVGTVTATAAGIALAAGVLAARERAFPPRESAARMLYLTSGRAADRLVLGFDALAADLYWIRTIQHYGRDRRSARPDRFALLQPLLDLTTSLDPRFNIAYRFGAVFLSLDPPNGPSRPDQAIALLEKALTHNPDRWQYALDIGFVHYWSTGDFLAAAEAFERAATMPGAPEWLAPLAATTRAQGGDRAGARVLLRELATAAEAYLQRAARRALAQIDALDAIDALQARVDRYVALRGAPPRGWPDLAAAGLAPPGVPLDPAGTPLTYDPVAGRVGLSPESPLAPLPAFAAPRTR